MFPLLASMREESASVATADESKAKALVNRISAIVPGEKKK